MLGTVAASVLVNFMVSFMVALSVVPRVSVMSMLTTRCCAMSEACVCGVRGQGLGAFLWFEYAWLLVCQRDASAARAVLYAWLICARVA